MSEVNPHQDEIDFLMEREYVLQGELDRVHERLEKLLGHWAVEQSKQPELLEPPQLTLIIGGGEGSHPDGAA